MPEYAERPEPSYSGNSSGFQHRTLTEEEKEAQRLERERQLEKERAERERWNALSPEEQEAERKAKREREQASVDQEIAKYLAYQKEEAAKRAKEEQEQAKKKASQPQPVVNEPSAEERQRRALEQETIIGVKRHYSDIKKKYITRIRKRVPDIKQRFAQFEAKASQEGLEVGTQSFVAELEATFGGLKWGVMKLDDPTPKPTMTDSDGFAIVEHSEKANKVDASNTQISKSVGADGLNLKADVITIQTALLKLGLLSETAFREESTAATNTTTPSVEQEKLKQTIAAIRKFQEEVLHLSDEEIDGRINGNDSKTLSEMRAEHTDVDYVQGRIKGFEAHKTKKEKEEEKQQVEGNDSTIVKQLRQEIPSLNAALVTPEIYLTQERTDLLDQINNSPLSKVQAVNLVRETYHQEREKARAKVLSYLNEHYYIDKVNGNYQLDKKRIVQDNREGKISKTSEELFELEKQTNSITRDPQFIRNIFHNPRTYDYELFVKELEKALEKSKNIVPKGRKRPEQVYNPTILVRTLKGLMLGDNNMIPASGEANIEVSVEGRFYAVFFVKVTGGAGVEVGVPNDRSFTAQVTGSVTVETGVEASAKKDETAFKASVAAEVKGSVPVFAPINGRFDSVAHFGAHFNNALLGLCQEMEVDPKLLGLHKDSLYWKTNEGLVRKRYLKEEITETKLSANAEVGDSFSGSVYRKQKNFTRNEHRVDGLGEQAKRTSAPEDKRTIVTYGTEVELDHYKLALEYNTDENSEPLFLDITIGAEASGKKDNQREPDEKPKDPEKLKSIPELIAEYKDDLSHVGTTFSLLNSEKGKKLIQSIVMANRNEKYKKVLNEFEGGGGVEAVLRLAKTSQGWVMRYLRFNTSEEASISKSTKLVGAEVSGSVTNGLFEILGPNDLGYISQVYNGIMWEKTKDNELARVSESLAETKAERANLSGYDKKQKQDETWGSDYKDSVNWELFKFAHGYAMEPIMQNFANGVKEAMGSKDSWDNAVVMDVKLATYFGEWRIAKDHPLIEDFRKKEPFTYEQFKEHVLFNKFKDYVVERME